MNRGLLCFTERSSYEAISADLSAAILGALVILDQIFPEVKDNMKSLEDKIAQVQPRPNNLVFVLGSMLESMLHSTPKSNIHKGTTSLHHYAE